MVKCELCGKEIGVLDRKQVHEGAQLHDYCVGGYKKQQKLREAAAEKRGYDKLTQDAMKINDMWEYKQLNIGIGGDPKKGLGNLLDTKMYLYPDVEKQMNNLGKEGWELVAVFPVVGSLASQVTTNAVFLFKRRVKK